MKKINGVLLSVYSVIILSFIIAHATPALAVRTKLICYGYFEAGFTSKITVTKGQNPAASTNETIATIFPSSDSVKQPYNKFIIERNIRVLYFAHFSGEI